MKVRQTIEKSDLVFTFVIIIVYNREFFHHNEKTNQNLTFFNILVIHRFFVRMRYFLLTLEMIYNQCIVIQISAKKKLSIKYLSNLKLTKIDVYIRTCMCHKLINRFIPSPMT